eukprot:468212-Ditylum_brightwellii.AAC.2
MEAPLSEERQHHNNGAENSSLLLDFILNSNHIQWVLGTLNAENIYNENWIGSFIRSYTEIAIDGSVAKKKGYFVVVIYTKETTTQFQGPCDCAEYLIPLY